MCAASFSLEFPPVFADGRERELRATTGFVTLPGMSDKTSAKKGRSAKLAVAGRSPPTKAIQTTTTTPTTKTTKTTKAPAGATAAKIPDPAPLLALFERILRQDQKALAALYEQTVGRVYGLALRITRNEAAAEEIAEDVYMQVWKSAATYSLERGHPLAWIMVITRSRALDYLRRADRAESHPEPETLADYADSANSANNPQDLLLAMESGTALHAAIARLPALQRQLLALAFFQGLSHSEIAAHARLPLGTIKTHLRRALQSLRAALVE